MRALYALRLASLAIMILAVSQSTQAHEYPICKDTHGNSCWSFRSEAKTELNLRCTMAEGGSFNVTKLEPGKFWSYQFCSGLADGLGFSAGTVSCTLERPGRAALQFTFAAPNPGDRVEFTARERDIEVRVLPYWSKQESLRRFVYR